MNNLLNLTIILLLVACHKKAEPETYIIPESFKGKVNIIFDRKEGNPAKYDNGRRVYEIPSDGILLTQFSINDGLSDRIYYKKRAGELKTLKILEVDSTKANEYDKNEVGIFLNGVSGIYGSSNKPNSLKFQEFIVSSFNELDSFFSDEYKGSFNRKIEKISGLKL